MKITMKTSDAIASVRAHEQQHLDEYGDQLKGWQEDMSTYTASLKEWSAGAAQGKDRPEEPWKPEAHAEDYERMLRVLYAHEQQSILLEERDIQIIIHDEWHWKGEFGLANSTYGGRARPR